MRNKQKAFSLAEVLISLLVVSIILSVTMPTIIRRNASSPENTWRWVQGSSPNIFAIAGDNQKAILGASNFDKIHEKSKLSIVKPDSQNIEFLSLYVNDKKGDTYYTGSIRMDGCNFGIGTFEFNSDDCGQFSLGYNSDNNKYLYGNMKDKTLNFNGIMTSNVFIAKKDFYLEGLAYNLSDKRLKNIQGENTSGLNEIKQLSVKNFTYKNDETKQQRVGVIAQDLQKVFPNSVKKGNDGYLQISKEEMFYAMINSIKELLGKLSGLDKRVEELEKQNKDLEERLNKLENK